MLDAGCGWGTTLEALEARGYRAVGADISRKALELLDRPGRDLVEADLTKPLPGSVEPFDAVLALDVIEHLDDDAAAVRRLGALARPGGVVIVSVPALPEFFTEFDSIQGHRRRYLPETLRSAFEGAELELERVFWWGSWLVSMLRWSRRKPKAAVGEFDRPDLPSLLGPPSLARTADIPGCVRPRTGPSPRRQARHRDVPLRRRPAGRLNTLDHPTTAPPEQHH